MGAQSLDSSAPHSTGALVRVAAVRATAVFGLLGLLLFGTAGTLGYWPAWVYLGVLAAPMAGALVWLVRNDPALLERRMRLRERESGQRHLIAWSWGLFVVAYAIPGLDWRFGWSHIPVAAVLAADAVVLAGYLIVLRVFRENSYASRVVTVEADQQVISTGPYAVVRHPMYVGVLLLYGASPVALASWWAAAVVPLLVWMIVVRIRGEEIVLRRDLVGYEDYARTVRYRLLPGVW